MPRLTAATAAGAVALSVVLSVRVVLAGAQPRPLLPAGGALYLLVAVGLTVVRHVPLDDALALVDAHGPQVAQRWTCADTVRAA